ncbi:MAG TPA: hypothetical protein VL283_01715 [Candidatus Baltobacteraceae bacterium]|nr:hypothetical protein [Candidatus Baltobacteraceae bacterium]
MSKHPYLLIFLLSAAFFGWVHATPGFGDPDAYYHLEMARRTMASGPVLDFPWLPLTTLSDHFADHHFLYHLALIPFIAAFGDFVGLKAATVLFAALAVVAFRFLLKEYGARRSLLWTLPLLLASGFVFRLLLTKATALALAAFFLFLVALRWRSRPVAFGIAFAYVWLHGGWPLLLAAAGLDAVVRRSARLLWPTALGLAAGLVINPFFPANLSFYWEQIVQIAVIGRRDAAVVVGNEWYPSEFAAIFLGNAAVFLPLVAAAAALSAALWTGQVARAGSAPGDGRRRDVIFASSLALLLLVMTLRQARHKEYFLPIALLSGALIAETAFAAVDVRALLARLRRRLGPVFLPAAIALSVLSGVFVARAMDLPRLAYADRPVWTRFEKAGAWMGAHIPDGETVFHVRWDDFPQLWYRAPGQRYIAGLDALFLYRKDPAKYWLWRDIGEGRRREGLAASIERGFGARYVLLRMEPGPLRSLIKKDPSFERVYADGEAEIWKIRAGR